MNHRLALGAVVASTVLVTLAYGSAFLPGGAPPWGVWAFVVGMATMMTAMMVLGAARPGQPLGGALRLAFGFTFAVLVGGFGVAILLPAPTADSPLWLGLPAGAAVVLYGVGLLPLAVLPLAYALTFDDQTLSEGDLARLRAAAGALRGTNGGEARAADGAVADAGGPPQLHDPATAPRGHHPSPAARADVPLAGRGDDAPHADRASR